MIQLLRALKNSVVREGLSPHTVKYGALRGIRYELDLKHETQLYFGLYELEIQAWLSRLSRDARVVVDVGAAFGYYSLYFLVKTKAEKIFAFEPLDHQRIRLSNNLKLNTLSGSSRLILSPQFVGTNENAQTVKVDGAFKNEAGPMLIKIDVEGAEMDVLNGCVETMKRIDCRFLIETHSKALEDECIRFFEAQGYQTVVIRNAWWRSFLPEVRPLEHNRWLVATKYLSSEF